MSHPRLGVAVLTMGNRPAELAALLQSVARQDLPAARVVVVGNGSPLPELPAGVDGVELAENLGVSGGRNVAIAYLRRCGDVDVVVDLDDDGLLVDTDVFSKLAAMYAADPALVWCRSGSPTSAGRRSGVMCRGCGRRTRCAVVR